MQNKAGELAFADDLDQARGLQLFHVMREGCSADMLHFVQTGALHRIIAFADLLKNLYSARFGQDAGNPRKLLVCQADIFGSWHYF